ncbi:hypothetical protein [Caldicellulosiruptor naganoensis]|uniref:Uncharacterized protein n=1 Tax=Caldicellulosiruptor naganoensis TaxID=29324 RepID=A0ABY7BL67_9FIRM|nr:hypothetical protein [Caldicellulosiruptor naganoensis]WAM31771.1 hypothetical protein OTJ99_000223 [Caldicellulosiruptor naganoensis]
MRVAWSATHQEFLLSDGYYFSGLYKELSKRGVLIEEVEDFDRLFEYDVIIFNYPENPFEQEERERIKKSLQEDKKRIIFTAHFRGKDGVAEICNAIAKDFGINIMQEAVKDESYHLEDDNFIITTNNIEKYASGVKEVVFPYSAPLSISDGVEIILKGRDTAVSDSGQRSPILIAQKSFENGSKLIVCGGCIFWDNFSLFRLDNLQFVMNLILGNE